MNGSNHSLVWKFAIANLMVIVAGAATGAGIVAMARADGADLFGWTAAAHATTGRE